MKMEDYSDKNIFENGLSYVNIPGPRLRPLTVGQLLDRNAKTFGIAECVYDAPMKKRLTFQQLKNEVDLFASGLLKLGMSKGDRIGIWGINNYQWIVTYLAAAKVGIVVVPINPVFEATELLYALNYMSLKCLVLTEANKTRDFYKILKEAVPDMSVSVENGDPGDHPNSNSDSNYNPSPSPIINSTLAPHLKIVISMEKEKIEGARQWAEVQRMGEEVKDVEEMQRVAATVQFDDILHVIFTSGTTGQAKGSLTSHHALINGVLNMQKYANFTQEDRHCLTVPLCHVFGILVGIMYPLCFGSSAVIASPTYSPSTAIKVTAEEKCNWIHGTPTMHSDMMSIPGFDLLDLSALKRAFVAGAPSARTLLDDMKEKYGITSVTTAYGMTEAFIVTFSRFEDPPELIFNSVGYPLENVELKIIDARGRIVPRGEAGEICARTNGLMQGYWDDEEKTREVIDPARWFHTGDAGFFRESGHLAVVGRFKDMLIRGGENIYPKEVEDFLYEHLEIEEVHVFGVSDERLGEVVGAWILPKSGVTMDTDQVKRVCEGNISRRKIPVYVKFVQKKDDFPRSTIGKGQKHVMRQLFEKELGLAKEI